MTCDSIFLIIKNLGCINTNYAESGNTAWKYETSIDALIDGCRTGVYMDHYSNARISAVIKTRQANRKLLDEDESLNYAECGIHLANCKYIDLRSSRIIDKDPETDTLTVSDDFCHVNLDGICRGLMIENSLCSKTDGFNIRDYIHTTIPENFDNITILGEPSSRFFEIGNYDTANLYKNYRINSNGDMVSQEGITSTDYISCHKGSLVKLENINIDFNNVEMRGNYRILFYDDINYDNEKYPVYVSATGINDKKYIDFDTSTNQFTINTECGKTNLTVEEITEINKIIEGINYFRICCNSTGLAYNSTINVDGDITAFKFGDLKDQVYVKSQYVEGLEV